MAAPDAMVEQRTPTERESQARTERFPRGAAVTLEDLSAAGREQTIDDLREHEPLTWLPAFNGWFVSSREAARQVLRAPTVTVQANQNLVRASLGRMMLTVDGEEHTRLRVPFEPHFKTGALIQTWSATIAAEADRLLDEIAAGGSAEIGEAFAAPFAVRMAGNVLGLSLTDTVRISDFYAAFADAMVYDGNPEPQRHAEAARAELDAILLDEIARSRADGGSSLTALLAADGQGLSDHELAAQLRVIMFGAIETVQASIMNTLLLLVRHPEAMAAVRADRTLLGPAAEEAGRLIPPVAFAERWTRETTSVAGIDIPAGEFIGISILGANRDPATFTEPLTYDIHRPNKTRALTFSFGLHACLGLHLARLQTTTALHRIVDRLPDLHLEHVEEPAGFTFRRPARLNLAWTAPSVPG